MEYIYYVLRFKINIHPANVLCPRCVPIKVKRNSSHYRPDVPRGFQEVKVPRLRDNGPGWW